MNTHKAIYDETLDETMARIGAEESDLVTATAGGVTEFESSKEREWYEGRAIAESKRIHGRRKYNTIVERNRETAKNRKSPTYPIRFCATCGKEFQASGPRTMFCSTSGPGNCKDVYIAAKRKKLKSQKEAS